MALSSADKAPISEVELLSVEVAPTVAVALAPAGSEHGAAPTAPVAEAGPLAPDRMAPRLVSPGMSEAAPMPEPMLQGEKGAPGVAAALVSARSERGTVVGGPAGDPIVVGGAGVRVVDVVGAGAVTAGAAAVVVGAGISSAAAGTQAAATSVRRRMRAEYVRFI